MRRLAVFSLLAIGTTAAIVCVLSEAALERLDRPKRVEGLDRRGDDEGAQRDGLAGEAA